MTHRLTAEAVTGMPEVCPGDDLAALIAAAAPGVEAGNVVVVSQKVVSKAEDRMVRLSEVEPSARAVALATELGKEPEMVQLVLDESTEVLRAERGVLIVRTHHGFVCANAGVDRSNPRAMTSHACFPSTPTRPRAGCVPRCRAGPPS